MASASGSVPAKRGRRDRKPPGKRRFYAKSAGGGDRKAARATAESTLAQIEQGSYRNAKGDSVDISAAIADCVKSSVLYDLDDEPQYSDDAHALPAESSSSVSDERSATLKCVRIEVSDETTLACAERLATGTSDRVCALNFASAKNPGGGFLGGARAQEESLARSSALYPCLTKHQSAFYDRHSAAARAKSRESLFYSERVQYASGVPVWKRDDGAVLDRPYLLDFVTAPAVNAGFVRGRLLADAGEGAAKARAKVEAEISARMTRRIWRVLEICRLKGVHTLVLGAFGCGVFKNDLRTVAGIFKGLMQTKRFSGAFDRVVFAVPRNSYAKNPEKCAFRVFSDVLK